MKLTFFKYSIIFILLVYGAYGCVMTSSDQKVNAGTDVHLSCNFFQCPGHQDFISLSAEWEFQVQTITNMQLILFICNYKKNKLLL